MRMAPRISARSLLIRSAMTAMATRFLTHATSRQAIRLMPMKTEFLTNVNLAAQSTRMVMARPIAKTDARRSLASLRQ